MKRGAPAKHVAPQIGGLERDPRGPLDDRSAWNREQSFHLLPNSARVGARGSTRPRVLAMCLADLVDDAALAFCCAPLKAFRHWARWMKHSVRKENASIAVMVDGIVAIPSS